ncbi:hypothetical protein C5S31_08365 [ANME-1 cluster archaeon GoMg2]|nr:hypothetical protein [ANME-1 cluster archaeon GoMg2]
MSYQVKTRKRLKGFLRAREIESKIDEERLVLKVDKRERAYR